MFQSICSALVVDFLIVSVLPDRGSSDRASAARSGIAVMPASVIVDATGWEPGSNGRPSGGQHSGSSQRSDQYRPPSARSTSRSPTPFTSSHFMTVASAGTTCSAGPYPMRTARRMR